MQNNPTYPNVIPSCSQGYSVRRVERKEGGSSVYMTLAFAGLALMAAVVAGVVVIKKRGGRHPHHQVRTPMEFSIGIRVSPVPHSISTCQLLNLGGRQLYRGSCRDFPRLSRDRLW